MPSYCNFCFIPLVLEVIHPFGLSLMVWPGSEHDKRLYAYYCGGLFTMNTVAKLGCIFLITQRSTLIEQPSPLDGHDGNQVTRTSCMSMGSLQWMVEGLSFHVCGW
ncbi:hypothetical protein BDN72DRAFT_429834 [Pluteus cervinus]|uniref:Uncharacterized protein n=1 Tax=Pluteus cervinus TaxID=181527 RepID=A0ACD3AA96_9AGAR|nr:hypothetical protein BDN72DRAFT_429834 [Pluteus cervinus]